jgi:hypothetical protein
MICIKESFPNQETIVISVEGKLDPDSLPTLKEVCEQHLASEGKQVILELAELQGTSLEAKKYLKKIGSKAQLNNVPDFLAMELFNP